MPGAMRLGQLFGIEIKVHFSWVFIFLLVAWSLATQYLPSGFPGWSRNTYWGIGGAGSALLFVSVLVHEFSHSLVARSHGKKVRGITLFFLGGAAEIEEESASPGEEFWISVVGPLTSFALAAAFQGVAAAMSSSDSPIRALAGYLAFVNLALGVFNLLPAFPLDGGRVLRAFVWKATGSAAKADSVAGFMGSVIGAGLIALGVYFVLAASLVSGLWFIFIGWFIHSTAAAFGRRRAAARALSGKVVSEAMQADVPRVTPGTTVESLVNDHIVREFQRAYVVALEDSFLGLVTLADVRAVPVEERPRAWVTGIMRRAEQVITVRPDEPLETALQRMLVHDIRQVVVLRDGKAVGLLTRGDVLRVLEIAHLLPG